MTKVVKVSSVCEFHLKRPGEYHFELIEPGATLKLIGRFQVKDQREEVVRVTVRHRAPGTVAQTSLRGTSADRAKLTLFGRIVIEPDCPGSQSFLEERLLLLSPWARGESVPELEIKTDDVRCSHAASMSALEPMQVFYLQSRGLSLPQAEKLLVEAFLAIPDQINQDFAPSRS